MAEPAPDAMFEATPEAGVALSPEEMQLRCLRKLGWEMIGLINTPHDDEDENIYVVQVTCQTHHAATAADHTADDGTVPGCKRSCDQSIPPRTAERYRLSMKPYMMAMQVTISATQAIIRGKYKSMASPLLQFSNEVVTGSTSIWQYSFDQLLDFMFCGAYDMWKSLAMVKNPFLDSSVQGCIHIVYVVKALIVMHTSTTRRRGTKYEHIPFLCTDTEWTVHLENPALNIAGVTVPRNVAEEFLKNESMFINVALQRLWMCTRGIDSETQLSGTGDCLINCRRMALKEKVLMDMHSKQNGVFSPNVQSIIFTATPYHDLYGVRGTEAEAGVGAAAESEEVQAKTKVRVRTKRLAEGLMTCCV